jgi:hypothetical protein
LGDAAARARADLLIPLVKAYGTDIGVEVASLGVQVHGGMGFIEETGAAQYYRDARIAPIYEGTNGIQAADLVGRKLGMEGGAVIDALLAEIRADAAGQHWLHELAEGCAALVDDFREMSIDERMTASYPFLTMLSVAVSGWLMRKQAVAAEGANGYDPLFLEMKQAAASFYLEQIVPEAIGLIASAMSPPEVYAVSNEAFGA